MELFGGLDGEEEEEIESVMMAVEDLKKHINAIDNAVQHHDEEIEQLSRILIEDSKIETNAQDINTLKKVFRKFNSIQTDYVEKIDVLDSELNKTDRELSQISSRVEKIKKSQDALFEEVEDIKEKISDLEGEFLLDSNRQEWDLNSKLEESEFEDHKNKVERELSKFRASLNDLSDKIEDNNLEVDQS